MFCPNCGLELPNDVKDTCPACSCKLPFTSQASNYSNNTAQYDNPINKQFPDNDNIPDSSQAIPVYTENQQDFASAGNEEKIPASSVSNFLVWSIISTVFCCLPFGIVALVYSNKVNTLLIDHRYTEALRASNLAKTWNIVGTICGVIMYILYLTLFASSVLQYLFYGYF